MSQNDPYGDYFTRNAVRMLISDGFDAEFAEKAAKHYRDLPRNFRRNYMVLHYVRDNEHLIRNS